MPRLPISLCLGLLLACAAPGSASSQEIPQEYIHAGSPVSRTLHRLARAPRSLARGVRGAGRAIRHGTAAVGRRVAGPLRHREPMFAPAEFPNDPVNGIAPAGAPLPIW